MKKLILVMLLFLGVNVFADGIDDLKRSVLEITKNTKSIPIIFPEGKLDVQVFTSLESTPDSLVILPSVKKSNSEKEYFTTLTIVYRWFLKNYKIGKLDKKNVVFLLESDMENYPYLFKLSVNNLKLLNNRDFGEKDLLAFNDKGGMVYPIKMILKRGKFIKTGSFSDEQKVKNRYHSFLNDFSISPLIEGTIEGWYEKKKTK